jgi:hypothetical protein
VDTSDSKCPLFLQVRLLEESLVTNGNGGDPGFTLSRALEVDLRALHPELSPSGASVNRIALIIIAFVAIKLDVISAIFVSTFALVC